MSWSVQLPMLSCLMSHLHRGNVAGSAEMLEQQQGLDALRAELEELAAELDKTRVELERGRAQIEAELEASRAEREKGRVQLEAQRAKTDTRLKEAERMVDESMIVATKSSQEKRALNEQVRVCLFSVRHVFVSAWERGMAYRIVATKSRQKKQALNAGVH